MGADTWRNLKLKEAGIFTGQGGMGIIYHLYQIVILWDQLRRGAYRGARMIPMVGNEQRHTNRYLEGVIVEKMSHTDMREPSILPS